MAFPPEFEAHARALVADAVQRGGAPGSAQPATLEWIEAAAIDIHEEAEFWSEESSLPRVRVSPMSYITRELIAIDLINATVEAMDR